MRCLATTIRQNIAFGLGFAPCCLRFVQVEELLELVASGLWRSLPISSFLVGNSSSGFGQNLGCEPQVLLLDEPFGALDAKVRKRLRTSLRHLHERIDVTTICRT